MNSREYWSNKILEWDRSSYDGDTSNLGFVEKLASHFRGPIRRRHDVLLSYLRGKIEGKHVLEMGCSTGRLSLDLLQLGAGHVTGVDVAPGAITMAKQRAEAAGKSDQTTFICAEVDAEIKLIPADYVVGLGFIDYIDVQTLRQLFSRIEGRFLFSFPEKVVNIINVLHFIYLRIQGCPAFYKFRREDFQDLPGIRFLEHDGMIFITNFDPSNP